MLDQPQQFAIPATYLTDDARTVGDLFVKRVERDGRRLAFKERQRSRWVPTTWQQFHDRSAAVASTLLEIGLEVGDKVCIIGSTSPAWCYADIAGHLAGLVTLGAYPTLTAEGLIYILDHSDSKVVFVEGQEQMNKLLAIREQLPKVVRVIVWNGKDVADTIAGDDWLMSLEDALAHDIDSEELKKRQEAVDPTSEAIIVYTSGTTGPPKGALLSHANILALMKSARHSFPMQREDVSFSFLPLAHVAERVVGFYSRIASGISAAFATDIPSVLEEVQEVRPTVFGSVPRIFEKAYAKMMAQVENAPPLKQKIFRWAEGVGREVVKDWQAGRESPMLRKLQYKVADKLIFSKIRQVFGGRVRMFITGAAPIAYEILEFFWAAGMPIYEAYGMTEGTAISHVNAVGHARLGSVGKTLGGIEAKLADDKEILVRGPTVFLGYYKNSEATAETIDKDGWLHTGDIGKVDKDGYMYIVDRKKHIIITAGGKNLTPANIENELKSSDSLISQAHVHGDKRKFLTAIVTIGPSEAVEYGRQNGMVSDADAKRITASLLENPLAVPDGLPEVMKKVTSDRTLRQRIAESVRKANRKLARVETIKKIYLLDREFSLERDEITPTLKVKRKNIEKNFSSQFDRLYAEDSFGIVVEKRSGNK